MNVKRWLQEIDQNCDVVNRILVGNKNDNPDRKSVQTIEAQHFANTMNIQLFETSAKENVNVEEMFNFITRMLLMNKKNQILREKQALGGIRLDKNSSKRRKSKCC